MEGLTLGILGVLGIGIIILVMMYRGKTENWSSTTFIVETYTGTAGTPRLSYGDYRMITPVERYGNTYKFVLPVDPKNLMECSPPIFILSDNPPMSIYSPTTQQTFSRFFAGDIGARDPSLGTVVEPCVPYANGSTAKNTMSFLCAYGCT